MTERSPLLLAVDPHGLQSALGGGHGQTVSSPPPAPVEDPDYRVGDGVFEERVPLSPPGVDIELLPPLQQPAQQLLQVPVRHDHLGTEHREEQIVNCQ